MKKSVLVALADKHYLNQAKQLFSTVYWNSGWSGDYLLLAYETPESDLRWFLEKGIKVKHCSAPPDCGSDKTGDKITACKIHLFSEYLKQWDRVVYLDVDIVTRGSLHGLLDVQGFSACYSLGQTLKDNLIEITQIPKDISDELNAKYNLNKKAFNSGVMAFPTSIIHKNMVEDLFATFKRYVKYGLFGGDQLPLNIHFYDLWSQLPQAYNQITPLDNYAYDKDRLQGLVIHCVSFGNGPWDEQSLLFEEWQSNINKANLIDLSNIPNIKIPSFEEVQKRSKSVLNAYLFGGTVSAKNIFDRALQTGRLVFSNPIKLLRKIKELIG